METPLTQVNLNILVMWIASNTFLIFMVIVAKILIYYLTSKRLTSLEKLVEIALKSYEITLDNKLKTTQAVETLTQRAEEITHKVETVTTPPVVWDKNIHADRRHYENESPVNPNNGLNPV